MKTSTACESCQKWLLLISSIWSYPQLQTADTDSLSREAKQSLVMCGDRTGQWGYSPLWKPSWQSLNIFTGGWVSPSGELLSFVTKFSSLSHPPQSWPDSRDPLFLVADSNPSIRQWICRSSLSPSLKISALRSIIIITIIKAMFQIKTHFKQFL